MNRVADAFFEHRRLMTDGEYITANHRLQQLYDQTLEDTSDAVNDLFAIASKNGFLGDVSTLIHFLTVNEVSSIEN